MLDDPSSPHILTHAHGYRACEGFELVGFVDQDRAKAEAASARWGGTASDSVENISIRRPLMSFQYACLMSSLFNISGVGSKPVKFIFLEKPAVTTAAEADVVSAFSVNCR